MPDSYNKEYYEKNKAHISARNKSWADKHKVYYKNYYLRCRLKALDILGSSCSVCGFSDFRALEIDHINGNGQREREVGFHSRTMHLFIIANPDQAKKKYQVLCANCNRIKKHDKDENRKVWPTE